MNTETTTISSVTLPGGAGRVMLSRRAEDYLLTFDTPQQCGYFTGTLEECRERRETILARFRSKKEAS